MFLNIVRKIVGTKHDREIKKMRPAIAAINDLEPKMKKLSDADLKAKTAEFKEKLDNGASLDDLLIPAFAVCREAGWRALEMRHYDVQLIGGKILHEGKIAEMRTGEGKTLVATLPCYLNALSGKGVHLVTVNDYLAKRDAEWMSHVYSFLGLTTGVIHNGQQNVAKKRAYRCDITYGQNNEYGFDYLRDNMKFSIYDYAQRELNFAIVDEVDSILIDEARTPLIISGPGETASEKYARITHIIPRFRKDEHYETDEKGRQVTMTEEGMVFAQKILHEKGLTKVPNLYDPVNLHTLHILQQCLRAAVLYKRDVNYMVSPEGKVMIIDEHTGRTLPGRRWSDGLHQAVEAKELVKINDENITLATISFQNLFRLYNKLSGMTGTADTEAAEFHKIYELDVQVIPTNKPIARMDQEDLVYKSEREKFAAVADEIEEAHERGQPVLVGTTSVEKSEVVARVLSRRDIKVNVLNAKHHEGEAYVVAQAGTIGAVTVATNMAGRGTDIVLGGNPEMLARMDVMRNHAQELERLRRQAEEEGVTIEEPEFDVDAAIAEALPRYEAQCKEQKQKVLDAGGLYIVGTERHESRRIDNQLRGRSGRQGDPGESRFFLSLEDELMRRFAGERVQTMMDRMGMEEGVPIEHKWVSKAVENAQKKVEEYNFDIRKHLLEYDDVMNQQRKSIYGLRKQVLMGQYRTVPTEAQLEKGATPQPIIDEIDEDLQKVAEPILMQMVKHHAAALPDEGLDADAQKAYRDSVQERELSSFESIRPANLERDVYLWFGCQRELENYEDDPSGVYDYLIEEVGMSLSEQYERLLDLVDDLVTAMVEESCPPNKHYEDWELGRLADMYKGQFGIEVSGLERLADPDQMAKKLYEDAEGILKRKLKEFGAENYLRLFRNLYMEEIDRQWIEHLQAMDSLRDGIGLRGYGQRDPKREYKREGYERFMEMMRNIKGSVAEKIFRAERVTEEQHRRLEDQRRQAAEKRLQGGRASHAGAGQNGEASGGKAPGGRRPAPRRGRGGGRRAPARAGGAPAGEPVKPVTVQRERPKLGRNDPCHCGSGKKYKNCCLRLDQAAAAAAPPPE